MADLTEQNASQTVKITGASSAGAESNYVNADSNGNINTAIYGGTDNTKIGNVSDSLKTTGSVIITSGSPQYYLQNNKMFSASASVNCTSSGSDNPLILFKNPSGSGVVVYIVRVIAGIAFGNNLCRYNIYSNPTITTNGTTLTNRQRNIGNSPTSGTALTYTLPTISANGSLLSQAITGQNSNSVVFIEDFSMALQPNNNILLTGRPESNNRVSDITFLWVEEPI